MPRIPNNTSPIPSLRKRILKFQNERNNLLHNNDISQINSDFHLFKQTKHPSNRKGFKIHNRLKYLNHKISSLRSELESKYNSLSINESSRPHSNIHTNNEATSPNANLPVEQPTLDSATSNSSTNQYPSTINTNNIGEEESTPESTTNNQRHICNNCNRKESSANELNISVISSNSIQRRRNYRFLESSNANSTLREYKVCSQCLNHITLDDSSEANKECNTWPGFVWSILKSKEMHDTYDANSIWVIIPTTWRKWWLESVHLHFPTVFHNISLSNPPPILADRTKDITKWDNSIESGNLNKIADVCNKLLIPTVLCPWGCSEFLHKVGYISIQLIFQKHFQKCIVTKLKPYKLSTVESSRNDFLREEHATWLFNPKWRVTPSIAFVNNEPVFLTCKSHDNGTKKLHVHCCRWENNLSSLLSDQLCHAVVNPRTVKNTQVGYNSITYQMVEQRFSWNGPDTINISSVGKTNHNSLLLYQAEARSIANRSDMKSLLKRSVDDGKMSNFHANGIEEYSEYYSRNKDYEKYKFGATYVPFEIALGLKKEARNHECFVTIDDDMNEQ